MPSHSGHPVVSSAFARVVAVLVTCMGITAMAHAQTAGMSPSQGPSGAIISSTPNVVQIAPQGSTGNRNPARRSDIPDPTPPANDPRDSTTRPVVPQGVAEPDSRDTVVQQPGVPQAPLPSMMMPSSAPAAP